MIDQYQNTIIRFELDDHHEHQSIEIGIERQYTSNPRGNDFCRLKTGPWCVMIKIGFILSTGYMPPDAAREVAAAIVRHSEECDRRNQAEQPLRSKEPVDLDAQIAAGHADLVDKEFQS